MLAQGKLAIATRQTAWAYQDPDDGALRPSRARFHTCIGGQGRRQHRGGYIARNLDAGCFLSPTRIVVAATTWRCCVVGSGHVFTLGGWRAQVPKDRSDIAPGLGCRFDARLGYLDRFVSVLAMALDKSTGVDGQHIVPDFADHMRRPGKLHLAGPDPAADRGRAPRQKRWPASQVTATRERQAQARPGRSGGSARALDTGCSLSVGSAAVAATSRR